MEGEQPAEIAVGQPVEPDYLRSVYANQVNFNHTPYDFRLVFSVLELPTEVPENPELRDGKVLVRPTAVASVIVPATVMHAFLTALNSQFDAYMTQFGPPGLDPKGPGGMDA